MVVITSDQRDVLLDAVRAMYTSVANQPGEEYHFPTGRRACEYVGYPAEQLDRITPRAIESFAGVGYPFAANVIREGDTILDIGSGSGTDALLAALLAGPEGEVFALDMTRAMREKCLQNANRMGLDNIEVVDGTAEEIPLADGSVDVVTSNGVINLVPDKARAMREIYRVLKPGGRMQISDIMVREMPSDACRAQPQLWAECIVGATTEADYMDKVREAGLVEPRRVRELDYFAASTSDSTRETAGGFGAHSVTFSASKAD